MKKAKFVLLATLAILMLFGTGSLAAAAAQPGGSPELPSGVQAYLKLEGVCGESKASKFADWIELSGVEFATKTTTISFGGGGGTSKSALDHFTITKTYDCSSIPLFLDSVSGKHIKDGQIVFAKASDGRPVTVLEIDLSDIVVSEVQFDDLNERIALQPGKIEFRYIPQDAKGAAGPPVQGGWDFAKNSAAK
ncbi:Hcp family type VI secretion system effector [Cohnella caldifontis]|uniref:Hcp family type VI secretion system effector n=1 Tax=Cohnella caldifontis TaxID=3027471 RepID=UPI0023EC4E48|nr:type VI secretion system tube protein Hcp [Cohnella sp. YIM B05605]